MRTISTPAFDGQVVFKTKYQTLQTSLQSQEYRKQLEGKAHEILELYPDHCHFIMFLLARTEDIVFDVTEDSHPLLLDWRDFWAKWIKKQDVTDALQWRFQTDSIVIDAWIDAVAASNFTNPATLPYVKLTEEQREAMSDINHPLDKSE